MNGGIPIGAASDAGAWGKGTRGSGTTPSLYGAGDARCPPIAPAPVPERPIASRFVLSASAAFVPQLRRPQPMLSCSPSLKVAPPARIELATLALGKPCSIQLSYGGGRVLRGGGCHVRGGCSSIAHGVRVSRVYGRFFWVRRGVVCSSIHEWRPNRWATCVGCGARVGGRGAARGGGSCARDRRFCALRRRSDRARGGSAGERWARVHPCRGVLQNVQRGQGVRQQLYQRQVRLPQGARVRLQSRRDLRVSSPP